MSNAGPQDKNKTMDQEDRINLKVKDQDGTEVLFKIRRDTQLSKLLRIYSERKQLEYRTMRFIYNGHRITAKQTPDQLKMDDGDEIEAFVHQMGGRKD